MADERDTVGRISNPSDVGGLEIRPTEPVTDLPDPSPIFDLVKKTRQVLRASWVATGIGLSVGLLLGTLAVVALIDLVVPIAPEVTLINMLGVYLVVPGWVFRLAGLLVVVVPTLYALVMGVLRPILRRLGMAHVARRIETHIPGIHNRLVSCVDLARERGSRATSFAFYRRLVTEAIERIRGFAPSTVVDMLSLRRAGLFAATTFGVFFILTLLFSNRLPTALARIFKPFADIPPVTGTAFTVKPGSAKILRGEDIPFLVKVDKGEPKKLYVELHARPDLAAPLAGREQAAQPGPVRAPHAAGTAGRLNGPPLRYDLQKIDSETWKFTLAGKLPAGYENGFAYRVFGGGTWSKQFDVVMLERPKIIDYHALLHYPAYMGISKPVEGPKQKLDMAGPRESQIEVVVQSEGHVAEGEVQFVEARRTRVAVADRPERAWFEEKLPVGAKAEGWQWGSHDKRVTHSDLYSPVSHRHYFYEAPTGFPVHPGESLFAYVWIDPRNPPEAIMLQWNDGKTWEHRAYWGGDKILEGKPGTASRQSMGPLPEKGKWLRFEVPAQLVDLEGSVLRGMSFILFGGQCHWHAAGAIGPSHVEQQELAVVRTFPMHKAGDNLWAGTFPLVDGWLYRVELRDELGHPNQAMKEGKLTALPDNPPQILLESPGGDLVLSTPSKVPLVVNVYDDYGLADVTLFHRHENVAGTLRVPSADGTRSVPATKEKDDFTRLVLRQYTSPRQDDKIRDKVLDLVQMKVKLGEQVRYYIEARDRKGQRAKTAEFVVRVVSDPNASDKLLEAFEKSQDPFREKLIQLIAEQAKVREAVEKLAAEYAPLDQRIKAAQVVAQESYNKALAAADPAKPPPLPPITLDAESERQLAELRKQLAQLAAKEQQNALASQQLAAELAKMSDQASNLKMLPREMAEEMKRLQQAFQQMAVQPLQDLAARMNQGSTPQRSPPNMPDLRTRADDVQKNLEAMKQLQEAVARAQKRSREDAEEAMAELRREMENIRAGLNARDLEELRKFIAQMQRDLQQMQGAQEEMLQDTRKVAEKLLGDLEKKQTDFERQLEDAFGKTRDLQSQARDKARAMRKRDDPRFPKEPYNPETDEKKVRPTEEDTPEADKGKDDKGGKNTATMSPKPKDDKAKDDEEEKKFMPALGGPKPKVDPRYADKQRPVDKKPNKNATAAERRGDLEDRQEQRLNELDQAQQSLESDKSMLDKLKDQLEGAMKQNAQQGQKPGQQGKEGQEGQESLAEAMRSQAMQQALQMAQRMRQMRNAQGQGQGQRPPGQPRPQMTATSGNLAGGNPTNEPLEGELSKLDPATRSMVLKMQPRLREELLQGMREEGPEGYRKFIQDYFKRLTEDKTPKK